MKKRFLQIPLILLCFIFIFSCRPGKNNANTEKNPRTYPCPQGLKTDVAWIVLEWNGKPVYGGYGSGFLIDKAKGAFFTNKHVSDMFDALGKGSHKIFFNCKVYNVKIVKTSLLADAALVQITDPVGSSGLPDPAPFAKEKVKIGDEVVIEGYHLHPYFVRMSDEEEGYEFPLIPIFKNYYNLGTKNLGKEQEIVFEKLEATVTATDQKIKVEGQGEGIAQGIREDMNLYIEIKTTKDHKFPFGGLSGTAVKNKKGEIIGIFTAGPQLEFDPETKEELPDGPVSIKRVFKTALLTPIESVENLISYLDKR